MGAEQSICSNLNKICNNESIEEYTIAPEPLGNDRSTKPKKCILFTFSENRTSDCYYGLPSIAKSDPVFASQNYWRGLTWGPMAQLVWWSLDEYVDKSTIVKNGQLALEKQMNAMMLHIYYNNRHICENYSPGNKSQDCTGDHYYHWGGLTGFLSLIHDYY